MKYFLLIIFCLSSIPTIAEFRCFNKDNYINYYFINGVWNSTRAEAEKGASKIYDNLLKENDYVKTIYNPSKGYLADIKEVIVQKRLEIEYAKYVSRRLDPLEAYDDEKFKAIKNLAKDFLSQISNDKQNVIFAHSQGNLFTNEMCELKDDQKIEVVAIAPPTAELKCNLFKNYVLFSNDFVINDLVRSKFKNTLKSTITDNVQDNGVDHHKLIYYLNNPEVVNKLKTKLTKTEDEIYTRDYAFPLIYVSIKPKTLWRSISSTYDNLSTNMSLWSREQKAYANSLSYLVKAVDSSQILSRKGVSNLLTSEIPAESEQEFVDVLAFSLNSVSSYCNQVFKNSKLLQSCKKNGSE